MVFDIETAGDLEAVAALPEPKAPANLKEPVKIAGVANKNWTRKQVKIRCKLGLLTCNEAEYAAAIFALDQTLHFLGPDQVTEVAIFGDSRVMVAKAFCALVAQKLRSGKRKWPKVQVLPLFLHILTVVFCIAFLIRLFHVVFKGFETQIGRVCPVL